MRVKYILVNLSTAENWNGFGGYRTARYPILRFAKPSSGLQIPVASSDATLQDYNL